MHHLFSHRRLLVLGLIIGLIVLALFIFPRPEHSSAPTANKSAVHLDKVTPLAAPSVAPVARRFNTNMVMRTPPVRTSGSIPSDEDKPSLSIVSDRPRFTAGKSNAATQAAISDPQLQSAASSLRDYRKALNQNPVGNNADITRALAGKNSSKTRYLPTDARVNDKGQLIDRWDQPIFFHQISRTDMEIRSAGADRVMWTSDDEVLR